MTGARRCGGWFATLAWRVAVTAAVIGFGAGTVGANNDAELRSVQMVCGRCHTTAVFLNKPRSWDRWNDVFADMTRRGANGTDEQLALVTTYFLENLTLVNVNSSPADEIAGVLGVGEDVAAAIIGRRQRQPFANIGQLRAVPGVDPVKLDSRKSRILF